MVRWILILFLFFAHFLNAQNSPNFFAFTQASIREKTTNDLIKLVDATVQIPLTDRNYQKWKSAFWAMELMLYKPKTFEVKIPIYINQFEKLSAALQWSFLEALFTLYPGTYANELQNVVDESKTDKIKVLIFQYLYIGKRSPNFSRDDVFFQSTYFK